jgi:hypothetical protein
MITEESGSTSRVGKQIFNLEVVNEDIKKY